MPAFNQPLGFANVATLTASAALPAVPGGTGPLMAMIRAEGQPVRWRDDGTPPTASVGMLLNVGETLNYDGDLAAIRFIQTAATASLSVAFYARA